MTEPDDCRTIKTVVSQRAWIVLVVVTGALFLEGIDIAMLNVAVPSIAADIGLAPASAHWVISAYVLAYAGFMILGGRAADILGRRRVFLVALALFALFSVIGGLANESWMLIVVRFVTGATAGFMTPAGFSILTSTFPEGPLRNKALAVYGAIGASGFLLGVVAGGLLTSLDWRFVFFAPAALGLGFLAAGSVFVPLDGESTTVGDSERGRFDIFGGLTLTVAMVSFVYGIVTLGADPNSRNGVIAVAVAILVAGVFVSIERRAVNPLLPPGILTTGLLPWMSAVGLLFIGSFFAWQFVLTLFLQQLLGWTPLQTGIAFSAMGIELLIAPFLTPRLVERFGNVTVMAAGLVAVTVGFVLTLRLDAQSGFLQLLPSLLLLGVAFAFIYGPLTAASVEGVSQKEHGVAGGIVYTGFQFGAALGVAAATIVLVSGDSGPPRLDDYRDALVVPAVAAGLALAVGLLALVRQRRSIRLCCEQNTTTAPAARS